jgi:hypothetical protein
MGESISLSVRAYQRIFFWVKFFTLAQIKFLTWTPIIFVSLTNTTSTLFLLQIHKNKLTAYYRFPCYFSNLTTHLSLLRIFTKFSKRTSWLSFSELELKGINYWFCKFLSGILLDLGHAHFKFFAYPSYQLFIMLWKKKLKKITFVSFLNSQFFSLNKFFWFCLWTVGPYKIKGFHFTGEWVILKQGKKPFK